MNKQSSREQYQQKISCKTADHPEFIRVRSLVLFIFMLVAMAVVLQIASIAEAIPTSDRQATNLLIKEAQRAKASSGKSYRVAIAANSMEGWQRDAFLAIDLQKRLNTLAEQRKQKLIRTQRNQRAERRKLATQKKRALVKARSSARLKRAKKRKARHARVKIERSKPVRKKNNRKSATLVSKAKLFSIVNDPEKIQRCLNQVGFFNGTMTGQLDTETHLAFLVFRNDNNLTHRPNDIKDPVIQKELFSQCTDNGRKNLNTIVASVEAKKSTIASSASKSANNSKASEVSKTTASMNSAKKQARLSGNANKNEDAAGQFASDVLVATDDPFKPFSTTVKKDRASKVNIAGLSGSSSYPVRRINKRFPQQEVRPARKRFASVGSSRKSSFSRRLRISDLAMAQPVSPNTCSPQNHQAVPEVNMNGRAMASYGGSSSRMNMAPVYDDGPVTTGSISPSSFGNSLRRRAKMSTRLVRTVRAQKACLPQDLFDLLSKTHGGKTDVVVCAADCLPAPLSFSKNQKKLFAKQYSINWCGSGCLGIADPLPLREVMKIESQADVHVCMTPQWQLSAATNKALDKTGINKSIRSLFDHLPGGYGNENNIAVIIGNKNYGSGLKKHTTGHVDAAAMKALLVEQLGYDTNNIIMVTDAKRADFVRLFGQRGDAQGELYRRFKVNPDAQLMIYYSGHASSSGLGLNNYLLPVDAISGIENRTAYSLNVLYDNLRELDARSTQLFLEAGFAANHGPGILPPNIAERRVNIAPLVPVRGLAIFSAATGDQKPLVDHEMGIGLFTRFLVGGLAGAADKRPIGNGDRIIDSVELHVHLANNVRLAARKTLGLRQNPTLSRSDNLFLSQLSRKHR